MSVSGSRLGRVTSDIPPWAGSVAAQALADLLAIQAERDWLDYKQQCDLSATHNVVELAKDLGAMMITGGYIVVGADDRGQPTGDVLHPELFDAATLHAKLTKYLPKPFEIRSATHDYQGQSYAILYIAAHQDGFCVFAGEGSYQGPGAQPRIVFRPGDVFARHGTRSERWQQNDITVIKRQLRADADRLRDDTSETLRLLEDVPRHLGGSGLWLAMAIAPEYQPSDAAMIVPDEAQEFLKQWQFAQAPIDGFSLSTATYRQPGGVVIANPASPDEEPYWWRLALHNGGAAVGAYVLTQKLAANAVTEDTRWSGLPRGVTERPTFPVQRDEVEIRLLTLLDVLTAHATNVGAGGRVLIMATLLTVSDEPEISVALLNQMVDENGNRVGWRVAGARANRPLAEVVMVPASHRVRLAEMRAPGARVRAAYLLAAELLAIFGIDRPGMLMADGTIDPDEAATNHAQIVYQHARHIGLPVDPVSPMERQQRLEAEIQAAQDKFRRR